MQLYVVRHAEAEHNIRGIWNDDPKHPMPITDHGKTQASHAAEELRDKHFDIIYVSPLLRTQETAAIINAHHSVPIIVDPRLSEQHTGFEGRPMHEYFTFRKDDHFHKKLDGHESYADLKARIVGFLEELRRKPYTAACIVTHMDPMQVIKGYAHKLADDAIIDLRFANCEIIEFHLPRG
jgi:broad specificity phosphatase PhoE